MSFQRILQLMFVLFLAGGMAACNTMEGAGEDIEQGGQEVSEAANDVEDEITD